MAVGGVEENTDEEGTWAMKVVAEAEVNPWSSPIVLLVLKVAMESTEEVAETEIENEGDEVIFGAVKGVEKV